MENTIQRRDKLILVLVRYVLGTIFLLSGVDAFVPFLPFEIMPHSAIEGLGGEAGYFYIALKGTEVLIGTFLIFNFFVPLILTILAPILFNILLYTIFEDISNLPMAVLVLLGFITLVVQHWKIFYIFIKPQVYSHPWLDESAKVVILEEVEEKLPEKAGEVKDIILKLENLKHG